MARSSKKPPGKPAKPTAKFVYLKIPVSAWATLQNTLELDANSLAFDSDLREKIRHALDSVTHLSPGEAVPT